MSQRSPPISEALRNQVVQLWAESGLSRSAIAAEAGVDKSLLTHLGSPKKGVGAGNLERLVRACDASLVIQKGDDGRMSAVFAGLPPERRALLLRFARAMALAGDNEMELARGTVDALARVTGIEAEDGSDSAIRPPQLVDDHEKRGRRRRVK